MTVFPHVQGLSNKECMQCALTAFEILSGQGVQCLPLAFVVCCFVVYYVVYLFVVFVCVVYLFVCVVVFLYVTCFLVCLLEWSFVLVPLQFVYLVLFSCCLYFSQAQLSTSTPGSSTLSSTVASSNWKQVSHTYTCTCMQSISAIIRSNHTEPTSP